MNGLAKGNAAIGAAVEQARSAFDLVDALPVSQLLPGVQEKMSHLQSALQNVLSCLSAAETYENKLRTEISWLKERLAAAQNWEAERDTFELRRFDPGVFVYQRKRGSSKPKHLSSAESEFLLCPYCFDSYKKSILQSTPKFERRYQVHTCPECRNDFAFYYAPNGMAI